MVANAVEVVEGRPKEPNDELGLPVAAALAEDNDEPLPLRPSPIPVDGGISSELPKACFRPSSLELLDAVDEPAVASVIVVDGVPLC